MAPATPFPRDTFIYRIDFSEDLFLSTTPNYAQDAPPTQPLFYVTSAPGHKILSSTQGTTTLSDTPHVQLHSGPTASDPVFGRGWYDGPFTSFVALDVAGDAENGTDERVALQSRHEETGGTFNVSYSVWSQFELGGRAYRIKIGPTEKTDEVKNEYLDVNAVMLEGNQYYLSGLELEVSKIGSREWKPLCAYTGAKTSMKYNPKRILGIVRWDDGEWVDDEAKQLGMTVIMVITEQARRMVLAKANDQKYCVVS